MHIFNQFFVCLFQPGTFYSVKRMNAKITSIPARSPDLNPIDNLFAHTKRELKQQDLKKKIQFQTFDNFTERVKSTALKADKTLINNLIEKMPKPLNAVMKAKGLGVNY